jgi:ribosomal-protein-alanine N-acetyltransferase
MIVRPAMLEDVDPVAAIERVSNPHPWSVDALRATLSQATTRAWVATQGRSVVGHVITVGGADTAEILLIAVLPAWRRRGVARALVAEAARTWRAAGVQDLWLDVRADNRPAIALYEAVGFRSQGTRRRYYQDGTDAVLMAWGAA